MRRAGDKPFRTFDDSDAPPGRWRAELRCFWQIFLTLLRHRTLWQLPVALIVVFFLFSFGVALSTRLKFQNDPTWNFDTIAGIRADLLFISSFLMWWISPAIAAATVTWHFQGLLNSGQPSLTPGLRRRVVLLTILLTITSIVVLTFNWPIFWFSSISTDEAGDSRLAWMSLFSSTALLAAWASSIRRFPKLSVMGLLLWISLYWFSASDEPGQRFKDPLVASSQRDLMILYCSGMLAVALAIFSIHWLGMSRKSSVARPKIKAGGIRLGLLFRPMSMPARPRWRFLQAPYRYLKVLHSFSRRVSLWIWPALIILLLFILSAFSVDSLYSAGLLYAAVMLAIAVGLTSAVVTSHAEQMLTSSTGLLLPRHRRPVLLIWLLQMACVAVLAAWVWPTLSIYAEANGAIVLGVPGEAAQHLISLYPSSLAIACIAAAHGACVGRLRFLSALCWLGWMSLALENIQERVLIWLITQEPTFRWAMFITSGMILLFVLLHLARKRDAEPAARSLWPRRRSERVCADEIKRPRKANDFTRVRLRRRSLSSGLPVWMIGLLFGGFLGAWILLLGNWGFGGVDPRALIYLSTVVGAFTAMVVSERAWAARDALLTHDLLLPNSRRQFFRQTGLGMLVDLLAGWVCGQGAMLLLFALLASAALRKSADLLSVLLPLSAGYEVVLLGAIGWLLRTEHRTVARIASQVFCLSAILPAVWVTHWTKLSAVQFTWIPITATAIGGFVLCVVVLRRWTRCDAA